MSSFYFYTSTVGKKYLMAVSGLIWAGFVFAHMAGNLLIFIGPDAYNSYGHALTSGKIIYVAEATLILALILHVTLAISLTIQNRRSGGAGRYAVNPPSEKRGTWASRTMGMQGSLILFFIINHLIMFKYGKYYETTVDGVVMRDLFRLVVEVFQNPGFVAWYVVALLVLFFHLSHGIGSIFQSLGLKKESTEQLVKRVGYVYGAVVIAGFLSQPLYCFLMMRSTP